MIKEAGIDFKRLPDSKPDAPLGNYSGAGVIFGVTGGVTEAVIRHVLADASPNTLQTIAECGVRGLEGIKAFEVTAGDLKLKIAVANGLGNADKLIAKVESGEEYFDFIEIMACPNGCIGGGGQPASDKERKAERMEAIFKADEACEYRISQDNPDLKYIYDHLLDGDPHHYLHILYPTHGEHSHH
jgi:NADH-quinone oxidoreductase subunit G